MIKNIFTYALIRLLDSSTITYLLKKMDLYSLYRIRRDSYLKDIGWFVSFRKNVSIDGNGNPLPWMTYSSISFLEKRISNNMTVFEYGCGNSTLWWAKHVNKIISCEHDKPWYERMAKIVPSNVELYHINLEYGGAYCHKISEYSQAFDVIVIDGRDRVNCAKNSLNALKKNGVIIWDNSDRESYTEGYNYLLQNGFKRLDFEGMGPINVHGYCTSIFYKEDNCTNL